MSTEVSKAAGSAEATHQTDMGNEPAWKQAWLGVRQGLLWGVVALALVLPAIHLISTSESIASQVARTTSTSLETTRRLQSAPAELAGEPLQVWRWVVANADNGDQPFALVDKRGAQLHVFAADGQLLGHTPILLGSAKGDRSVPGIGDKPAEDIRPEEKTTPAGRFVAQSGRNARGEDVVWVDYAAAVSMHPVLTTHPQERRLRRLADPDAAQRRISLGCINVPTQFFHQSLWPALGGRPAVVYVLPEVEPLKAFFPAAAEALASGLSPTSSKVPG